ncbi:MAG: hypothetical protein ACP5E4_00715 [Candidatus Aenigmatarchaeota archaeon]
MGENRILGTVGGIEIREQGLVAPIYTSLRPVYDLLRNNLYRNNESPLDTDPYKQEGLA